VIFGEAMLQILETAYSLARLRIVHIKTMENPFCAMINTWITSFQGYNLLLVFFVCINNWNWLSHRKHFLTYSACQPCFDSRANEILKYAAFMADYLGRYLITR